ncbi:MAG: HAMP domain-containing histidine kinase [Lachnospiraceae bacterium]|nr:HAMP domain-containing histidine kinase [Lachnospiraceae bacterium]
MFKLVKELNRKHPAATVISIFMLLCLLSCTMLTVWLGQDAIAVSKVKKYEQIHKSIEQDTETMSRKLRSSEYGADNSELLIKDVNEDIFSYIQLITEGEVYGYWRAGLYTEGSTNDLKLDISSSEFKEDGTVILKMIEEDGVTYLSCPEEYFAGVYKHMDELREQGYFVPSVGLYLTEGYQKGNEFRPLVVNITAIDFIDTDRTHEEPYCCEQDMYGSMEGFTGMENLSSETNRIELPDKNNSLELLTGSEMVAKCLDGYGDKVARWYTDFCHSWDTWESYVRMGIYEYFYLEPTEHRFLAFFDDPADFGFDNENNYFVLRAKIDGTNPFSGIKVPFSELKGDMFFGYVSILEGVSGERLKVMLFGIIKNGLGREMKNFFRSMVPVYIGLAVFFLVLAWYWLKSFYSLEGKSRFHRSLINSMAHDLKTPLMIMQGFSENLKDNIHREKHGYYAAQIVENAQYLEGLINKNIEVSNKPNPDPENRDVVHLSELIKKAESRYKERLEDKNLEIKQEGVSFLEGDPGIIGILVDNLISNAIKYSFEGETIEVFGTVRYFTIKNKAELHYNKNLKYLLDPLEMGDESRTLGAGTGLGLSIANGIAQERGWKMKLSYDTKNKIFTCKVILRKWL